MRELPSGTVTFLFTDVEGSTRLLQELGPEAYAQALADHRRALRQAFAAHDGVEVDTQGDAFFVAFPTAPGALAAAAELTEALAAGQIRARVGVHTGTPFLAEEGYVGVDVNRAARIAAAGHGGQVLVSASTAALTDGVELRDLGEHRFKDLSAPERVYQLDAGQFPPLKSLYRTNLPVPATLFLGRERELKDVVDLLMRDDLRLLTLTGPGGTGKTRLAVHAAAEASGRYPDGVWWVPLASLRDPALVLPSVARVLDAKGDVATQLAGKRALLLLDNAEHLLPDAAEAIAALRDADGPTLLVTSRERLQLQGEHLYPVPTLDEDDGVQLFLARVQALQPGFEGGEAVGELCARLDHLPLALELAAARTVVFSPEQLLERLSQRLDLLKAGRDSDPRQRTLRATIEWSYDLLAAGEQRLLFKLSVFVGGCTYEAVHAVCGADPDMLQSLLDRSLLRRRDTDLGPRYWMLETIREFAAERLEASGDAVRLGRQHAGFFLALAETLGLSTDAYEAGSENRHDIALAELDNLRTAIDWGLESDPKLGLRLAIALEQLWVSHDPLEGRRRFEGLLARTRDLPADLHAKALRCLGGATELAGDFKHATQVYGQSLELYERLGDEWGTVHLRHRLANCAVQRGDWQAGRALYEENLVRARAGGFRFLEAEALGGLGWVAGHDGDAETAYELTRRHLELCREVHWLWGETQGLAYLAELTLRLDRPAEAEEIARSSLTLARHLDDRLNEVRALVMLALAARALGEEERAGRLWGAIEAEEARGPLGRGEAHRAFAERVLAGGGHELERGLETGRRQTLEQAVASALEPMD